MNVIARSRVVEDKKRERTIWKIELKRERSKADWIKRSTKKAVA